MLSFIFALLLLGFGLLGIALRKIYYYLPPKELKRQAEGGDKLARVLWRAVAYGNSLRILLWLWIGLAAAGGFVLLAHVAPWFVAFLAIALLLLVDFAWFPRRTKVSGVEAKISLWLTPAVAWVLNYVHPFFDHTLAHVARRYPHDTHTDLFEADDLVELVERQSSQPDNRIASADLQRVKQVLTAHNYKVGDALTPRAQVKSVSDNDTIGLVLLDELHDSRQSSFPVRQGKTDKIIGALYLQDLGLKTEGKVRDYMQSNVRYLHEDDSLEQAMQAFFKTKQQLFVVVNSFEEYVGVATLEHIMQQLAGEFKADDFDQHDDLAAVANKHAHDDDEPEPEPAAPEPEDTDFDEVTEVEEVASKADEPADVSEPESELVTAESAEEAPVEEVADPENLAALDLPEEESKTSKTKGTEGKTAKSEDEVVE